MHKSKVQKRRSESIWPASNCHTSRTLIGSLWVFTCSKPIRDLKLYQQSSFIRWWYGTSRRLHVWEMPPAVLSCSAPHLLLCTPRPSEEPKTERRGGFKRIKHFSLISTRLVFSCSTDISQKQTRVTSKAGWSGEGDNGKGRNSCCAFKWFPPTKKGQTAAQHIILIYFSLHHIKHSINSSNPL